MSQIPPRRPPRPRCRGDLPGASPDRPRNHRAQRPQPGRVARAGRNPDPRCRGRAPPGREPRRDPGGPPDFGALDISMYRDDLRQRPRMASIQPTDLPFALEDRTVVIVDDVSSPAGPAAPPWTRCHFGRPARIQLAALVDRGHRELPIRARLRRQESPHRARRARLRALRNRRWRRRFRVARAEETMNRPPPAPPCRPSMDPQRPRRHRRAQRRRNHRHPRHRGRLQDGRRARRSKKCPPCAARRS